MMSIIVRAVSRALYPFMMLFGLYIVIHGHLTPGGGFPGGVLLISAIILVTLAYGATRLQEEHEIFLEETLESDALIAILGILLFTVLLAKVLPRYEIFTGVPGTLLSGGPIPLLNISASIEVAAALGVIFFTMLLMRRRR
jgi:multicomponent Na+:H+ antiporter subunit B